MYKMFVYIFVKTSTMKKNNIVQRTVTLQSVPDIHKKELPPMYNTRLIKQWTRYSDHLVGGLSYKWSH